MLATGAQRIDQVMWTPPVERSMRQGSIRNWRPRCRPAQLCRARVWRRPIAPALETVAARYAVAMTPDHGRPDRSRRPGRSDRAPVRSRPGRARCRRRGARRSDRRRRASARSRASCTAIPTACCSSSPMSARSIAASASAARWSGPASRARCRAQALDAALDYIRAHPEIWEVILTGGDPLMLSPRRIAR